MVRREAQAAYPGSQNLDRSRTGEDETPVGVDEEMRASGERSGTEKEDLSFKISYFEGSEVLSRRSEKQASENGRFLVTGPEKERSERESCRAID